MNIKWNLKIGNKTTRESLTDISEVYDLYTKTKYGYFHLMIDDGGLEVIQEDYYDEDDGYDEEGYEEEIFGMGVKDFLETLKDHDDDFDYEITNE
tara:strand:- start:132 stop:416 length:285 start_codon:yes stop_codon:yes gene_type:complete